jgi:hypothetical protein
MVLRGNEINIHQEKYIFEIESSVFLKEHRITNTEVITTVVIKKEGLVRRLSLAIGKASGFKVCRQVCGMHLYGQGRCHSIHRGSVA